LFLNINRGKIDTEYQYERNKKQQFPALGRLMIEWRKNMATTKRLTEMTKGAG
jgi:hypothetical protein